MVKSVEFWVVSDSIPCLDSCDFAFQVKCQGKFEKAVEFDCGYLPLAVAMDD